ncbi:MAG: hypothetical protein WBB62_08220 [Rhodococcus sp. (in: high G+C Gram-positive bacteria)]
MTTNRGFGRYLSDDHRVAATLRAKKVQIERDERKRAHELEMFAKRAGRQAAREAAAEGSPSGRAARTAEQRQQDDAVRARPGFGRYLLPRE